MASAVVNLAARANDALNVNPTVADIDITVRGSDFLWFVFAAMAASGLGTAAWAIVGVERDHRTFHYLSMAILATASVAYFSLASDLGGTPIRVEFLNGWMGPTRLGGDIPTRSIWYVRYIDWTITTPLLLLELLLVTGLPLSTIFITIFFDLVMIITGLVGALVQSSYKFGFFALGCVAMFFVFYILMVPGLKGARALGDDIGKSYLVGTAILSFLWLLYPICWGLADGGNKISPDGEMVFYGVLDVLAKPVFAFVHMWSLRNIDPARLAASTHTTGNSATPSKIEGGAVHKDKLGETARPSNVSPQNTLS